jgi:hypothetical protein
MVGGRELMGKEFEKHGNVRKAIGAEDAGDGEDEDAWKIRC